MDVCDLSCLVPAHNKWQWCDEVTALRTVPDQAFLKLMNKHVRCAANLHSAIPKDALEHCTAISPHAKPFCLSEKAEGLRHSPLPIALLHVHVPTQRSMLIERLHSLDQRLLMVLPAFLFCHCASE
jgi:hypothetical protein